ncbi:MAG: CRISPR-associated endonuclease Cas1 [Sphaerochaeta sp.]
MATAYIVSQNGKLQRDGNLLQYSDYTGNITKLIPDKIDQIVVVGNLELTGQAFSLLVEKRIEVSFLQKNGRYNGKIVFQDSKNSILRHRQHLLAENTEWSLTIAKDIVRGKIHNEYLFMQRIGRKLRTPAIVDAIELVDSIRNRLEGASVIDEIRGFEGIAAKAYFSCFSANINQPWAKFNGRSKNPPKDEVNSVMSFLYTVLASRIASLIQQEGLDDSIGTLHSLCYGRKSLVYDLLEEYRTPIADTLTCSLFNLGVLAKNDFRTESIQVEQDDENAVVEQLSESEKVPGVLLTETGMKKVLSQLEKKLDQPHFYPLLEKTVSYKEIMRGQVKQYKQLLGGVYEHYQPIVVK